jgi:hypothetical protein
VSVAVLVGGTGVAGPAKPKLESSSDKVGKGVRVKIFVGVGRAV